ncbi:winged helix-turn-helix domain-containing protein [Lichenibacterium dinghuense]|uniref:winged helix-turn-helix domain-containing protein n=1 Tax=Lichenibacterium dinghuense TaxID=2895977 RepID=UPI001F1FBF0E|nr:crosslink repair DNA glycosylase YcaQ family protein [Lichenibacterium sp. 6Y81]
MDGLSAAEARRVALHAQGFGRARPVPGAVTARALAATIERLHLHQVDSVNVLVRAHYLPAFSRLGPYDRGLLEEAAWGARRGRKLFEYWAHECSLLPLALQPLFRWRMARADRGIGCYGRLRPYAGELRPAAMAVLERIRAEGPMSAGDFEDGRGKGGWWGWGETKGALEWLFWAGHLTTATRRLTFERVYDLPERVLPAAVLALPTPDEGEAHRALVDLSARAMGVASAGDLRDYFRLRPEEARTAVAELVEAGRLREVAVEGWSKPGYLHAEARVPRRVSARALLAPFDPLVWERSRAERLFGFRYRIEIYVPAELRQHGYYVLPFLSGDRLVARVDLKADRAAGRLVVKGVHWEAGPRPENAEALRAELESMAGWLGLRCDGPSAIDVPRVGNGDL